jgi:hypothetical protein
MLSKTFLKRNIFSKFSHNFKNIFKFNSNLNKTFAEVVPASQTQTPKKTYGGLSDADRIFTNVYRDGDPFIEGALKRVKLTIYLIIF